MQHLDDLHPLDPHPLDHPVSVARGDVVALASAVDPAAHLGELGNQGRKVFNLRQHGIGRNRFQGAEVVVQ